jgi:DHA1 family inner membrane transport protein
MRDTGVPARILPVITLSQFAGTSLWFAANAVMPALQSELALPAQAVGTLTSAVQLGFIAGTLVFALLAIADRFSPRRVFLLCSLAGAACALLAAWLPAHFTTLLALRAATGFFLAGIYPVGMKIAANWYTRGLGAALGVMLGALVLGTAVPHALRALGAALPWQTVLIAVALLAAGGGVLLHALVPDAPHAAPAAGLQWRALGSIVTDRRVRASVFGYFGHMWELYALWVLVPAIVATRLQTGAAASWAAFGVIGAGAIGCAAGGWVARRVGSAKVAAVQLATSGLCCLAAPWLLDASAPVFAAWLALWGITVVGDSPQFSALTANNAPREAVGSVLTLTNCIGFAISAASIEIFVRLAQTHPLASVLPWLGLGPLLGLVAMAPLLREGNLSEHRR